MVSQKKMSSLRGPTLKKTKPIGPKTYHETENDLFKGPKIEFLLYIG